MRLRFLSFAPVLLAGSLLAPDAQAQDARFGVYLGSSIATIRQGGPLLESEILDITTKRRVGLQAGLWAHFPITDRIGFQPELHYTQKGARFTFGNPAGESAETSAAIDYLEVPLLMRFDLAERTARTRPFFVAGPTVGRWVRCSVTFSYGPIRDTEGCEDESGRGEGGLKYVDVGATIGGGVALRAGGLPITLGLRYTRGFTSMSRLQDDEARNSTISLLLGLGFRGGDAASR